jgi:hypothetical protein
MKTAHTLGTALAASLLFLAGSLSAQTYLGNGSNLLNGTNVASTFEVGAGNNAALPSMGWTQLSGTSVMIWDESVNGVILNIGGGGFAPYSVQFVTDSALAANSTYNLSFRMGYVGGGTSDTTYQFSIGSWNGSAYTPLNTYSGAPVTYLGNFGSDGANGEIQSVSFTTGGSVSGDFVALRWAQTNTGTSADYFSFDNVTLSVAAIPEPSTYAAIAGACALGLAAWRRRRVARTVAAC